MISEQKWSEFISLQVRSQSCLQPALLTETETRGSGRRNDVIRRVRKIGVAMASNGWNGGGLLTN